MEARMINYGLTSAAEFIEDRILYRGLQPLQADLPGLADCIAQLALPPGRIPRKHEADYARIVAHILQAAQKLRSPTQPLQYLVYIGDTELLDSTAFANLCQVTGWRGFAFIGDETSDPPQTRLQASPLGELYLSNRWSRLEEFDQRCARGGCPVDSQTAIVIDLDKTILGARRRNAQAIDHARAAAMQQTLAQIIGSAFDPAEFDPIYHLFSQVVFHPFTSDNQDYLAYVCLMILGGAVSHFDLQQAVLQGQLRTFDQFIHQVEQRKTQLPACLAETHAQVYASVLAGDPTPFKAFRRCEYTVTVAALGSLPDDAPLPDLLAGEITLTQEVRQMALEWRSRGALLFGLSDKPDEASLPTPELAAQGMQPLHRTLTHAVGHVL
jgi:hypothetical protein